MSRMNGKKTHTHIYINICCKHIDTKRLPPDDVDARKERRGAGGGTAALFVSPEQSQEDSPTLLRFWCTDQMTISVTSICVCFLPIHSGHQVRWTYQPGSHRRKVTQDFSSTFFLRCVPSFFSRERFRHSFPSSTVKSNFVFHRSLPVGHFYFIFHCFREKNPVCRDRTHVPTCQKYTPQNSGGIP